MKILHLDHVRINDVLSEVNCNGIIDMKPDKLEALMMHMETDQGKENIPVNVSCTTAATSIQQLNCQKPVQFTPYITGCVVNFYVK